MVRVTVVGSFLCIAHMFPAAIGTAEDFQVTVGRRQLFLDDHGIARVANLRRTLHQPTKRGAVIRSPQPTRSIQTRSAPVWDENSQTYKLWMITVDDNLWESRDGLNWTPGPATNVPIMLATIDPLDPDPQRRFKASLLNEGFAVSPDGARWTRIDADRVPSSDEGNFSFDAQEGLFIHTVKRGGEHGRSVAVATSRDFNTWDDLGIVFQADDLDQELGRKHIANRMADVTLQQNFYNDPAVYNVDVYNMGVFRYEDLYIGMPAMYHAVGPVPNYPNTDGFQLIQLVCSRDLKNWQRVGDRQTFIGPSRLDSGAYDLTQLLPPSTAVVRDDELWFYYTGLKWRSTFTYVGKYPEGRTELIPDRSRDVGAVCLAVLRRDGFVSLDADEHSGYVLTRPFLWPKGSLYVNADAHCGELSVEILSSQGEVIATSETLSVDSAQETVRWRNEDVNALSGQTVALRFTLSSASLYSYWIE